MAVISFIDDYMPLRKNEFSAFRSNIKLAKKDVNFLTKCADGYVDFNFDECVLLQCSMNFEEKHTDSTYY